MFASLDCFSGPRWQSELATIVLSRDDLSRDETEAKVREIYDRAAAWLNRHADDDDEARSIYLEDRVAAAETMAQAGRVLILLEGV